MSGVLKMFWVKPCKTVGMKQVEKSGLNISKRNTGVNMVPYRATILAQTIGQHGWMMHKNEVDNDSNVSWGWMEGNGTP